MKNPGYTLYHPRWQRTPVSTYWWLHRRSYLLFILRELSSIFVAWFVVYLLMLVGAVDQGAGAYQAFLDWSRAPLVLLFNIVAFAFVLFHAITWFNLAPKAIVVQMGGRRVPGAMIAASNYVAWAAVSAVVLWLVFWA